MGMLFQNIGFAGTIYSVSGGDPIVTCTVTPSTFSVNEGSTVSFAVNTFNLISGAATLYWGIIPSGATNLDFPSNILPTGTITISNNYGVATGITVLADQTYEPAAESFVIAVYSNSNRYANSLIGTSGSITINDTSSSAPGQQQYTVPGTYSWTAPAGVTRVSVVAVGAGGGGGGVSTFYGLGGAGGGLGWGNVTVVGGQSYTVVVGAGGSAVVGNQAGAGGYSSFGANSVLGYGGGGGTGLQLVRATGGSYIGQGGGTGGSGGYYTNQFAGGGGGGAAGYTGNGGQGGDGTYNNGANQGTAGSGGGGGGGSGDNGGGGGDGGGVGIWGQGTSGAAGIGNGTQYVYSAGGGGSNGITPDTEAVEANLWIGGGGLGGGHNSQYHCGTHLGANGAVRIIWGDNRYYPATNTANV